MFCRITDDIRSAQGIDVRIKNALQNQKDIVLQELGVLPFSLEGYVSEERHSYCSSDRLSYGLPEMNDILARVYGFFALHGIANSAALSVSEAISNAFVHGNRSDVSKPIQIHRGFVDNCVSIAVEDEGTSVSPEFLLYLSFLKSGGGQILLRIYWI